MARRILLVLNRRESRFLHLIVMLWLASCGPEIPVKFYISSTCEKYPDEMKMIQEAAKVWNDITCREVLQYQGILKDDYFTMDDLQDNRFAVYCFYDKENISVNELAAPVDGNGNFTALTIGDILIKIRQAQIITRDHFWALDKTKKTDRQDYLNVFRGIMTHEFGHRIGLNHVIGPTSSIMQIKPGPLWSLFPTAIDLFGNEIATGICEIIPCPPADQCPTRP